MSRPALPCIAIIGGGYTGAAVLANLVRHASAPLAIEWFDRDGGFGPGLAYSAAHPCHRLNVKAKDMSAFPDQPDHFAHWIAEKAQGHENGEQPQFDYGPDDFVPRYVYGLYIKEVVARALAEARKKNIDVWRHVLSVYDVQPADGPERRLVLKAGEGQGRRTFVCDRAVLATGNARARPQEFSTQGDLDVSVVIRDVWRSLSDEKTVERIRALSAGDVIGIAGTGLTMVDVVLALEACGYKGKIVAISRRGLLPAAHKAFTPYPAWEWIINPAAAPSTALGLLRGLRARMRAAQAEGYDWRAVIHSLRAATPALWNRMDAGEQRRFLRRLMPYWAVHRHRMAPEIAEDLHRVIAAGRLEILGQTIESLKAENSGLSITVSRRQERRVIRAALFFSCTGIDFNISSGYGLLHTMKEKGVIVPHSLGMGVETAADGTARGRAEGLLYPTGNLLAGERFECTAVPELRVQADDIARRILGQYSLAGRAA
jgi:uncharacterized NAD(P)/FAD-binding protein YdhS